jgi:hypothetical protein
MHRVRRFAPLSLLLALPLAACSLHVDSGSDLDGRDPGGASHGDDTGWGPEAPLPAPEPTSSCSPAPALLSRALCVCNELKGAGAVRTTARPGQSADVGVEGNASFAGGVEVDGSIWTEGSMSFAGASDVRDHAYASGDLSFAGAVSVGGTVAVGGDLSGSGALEAQTLRVQGDASAAGWLQGDWQPYQAPSVPPCGCGAPYDVAGAVAAAREVNDNAAIDLDAQLEGVGAASLVLPSGRFYLSEVAVTGALEVRAEGAVLLYIDGDVDLTGAARFELAPGATLDLFVAGNVTQTGGVSYGDPDRPEAFRLYLGGDGPVLVGAGATEAFGMIYAPQADLVLAGGTRVHGAMFARNLELAGALDIAYAEVSASEPCTPEEAPQSEPPR